MEYLARWPGYVSITRSKIARICQKNRRIDKQKSLIFENKCRYDVILGSDFLTKFGMDIKYSDGTMHWFENIRPMREPWSLDNKEYVAMADANNIQHEGDLFGEDWLESYPINTIVDAKYEKVDVRDVTSQQKHLVIAQQRELNSFRKIHKAI